MNRCGTLASRTAATVEWDLYRGSERLRERVDRARPVPTVRQPPDPERNQSNARLIRRHRLQFAIGMAGYVIGGAGGWAARQLTASAPLTAEPAA